MGSRTARPFLPALLIVLLCVPGARAEEAPPHNFASLVLSLAGADTVTVELTKALAKAPDGAMKGEVSPALRRACLDALEAPRYRLPGLDEVVAPLASLELSADGRKIRLGYPDEASATRARVILKGYFDLIGATTGVGESAPQGAAGEMMKELRGFLLGVKCGVEGNVATVDLPDPAPLQAAMAAGKRGLEASGEAPTPEKVCESNLKTIEGATELFLMEKGPEAAIPSLDDLVTDGYLRRKPECPAGGAYTIAKDVPPRCAKHGAVGELSKAKGGGAK